MLPRAGWEWRDTANSSFSKATGKFDGMHLLGSPAWGPWPAAGWALCAVPLSSSVAPVGAVLKQSLQLGMFIIPLIMKPLHCSHSSELQLIDFHFVFSVKSYFINAEMWREQLISSRQFLFKWAARMCFAWGFLEREKGFLQEIFTDIKWQTQSIHLLSTRLLPFRDVNLQLMKINIVFFVMCTCASVLELVCKNFIVLAM